MSKWLEVSLILTLLLFVTNGCARKPVNELDSTQWQLTYWQNQQTVPVGSTAIESVIKPDFPVTLTFDDKAIFGSVGDNDYRADYSITDKKGIKFQHIVINDLTEDANASTANLNFVRSLNSTYFYAVSPTELIFYNQYGMEILVYSKVTGK